METQSQRILKHLQCGRTLTAASALHLFNTFRLAARVYDLRGKGHKIKARKVYLRSRKVVAVYSL